MGLLRFLLAVSVILTHTRPFYGFSFVGGTTAVEAFFVISGFYISLILNEKYLKANNSYKLYITNRFLRLYPFYWIVLILSLLCSYYIPTYDTKSYFGNLAQWRTYSSELNFLSCFTLIFTNLFLFFQDVIMFLGVNIKTGCLFFTSNFRLTNPPLFKFLLVPQAWSIGLELMFYLMAPFIVRRKYPIILILLIASMAAKFYAFHHGLNFDPWTYRFFLFELTYFLLGSLAYVIYKKFIENANLPKYIYLSMLIGLALFTTLASFIHSKSVGPVYCLCVFIAIPYLFKFTKKFKFDRFIGELSYPIYLTHILILNLVRTAGITKYQNIATILGSIVLSIILVKLVGDRLEGLRQGRVKNQKGVNKMQDALLVKFGN